MVYTQGHKNAFVDGLYPKANFAISIFTQHNLRKRKMYINYWYCSCLYINSIYKVWFRSKIAILVLFTDLMFEKDFESHSKSHDSAKLLLGAK